MTLFHVSLTVSTILLVVALITFRYVEDYSGRIMQAVLAILAGAFLSQFSITVLSQLAFLLFLAIGATYFKWAFRPFAITAVGSSILIYAISCFAAYSEVKVNRELREGMSMELVDERIPPAKKPAISSILTKGVNDLIDQIETKVKVETESSEVAARNFSLQRLHWRNTESFLNSAGFGVQRMGSFRPRKEYLELPTPPSIPQPAPLSESDRAYSLVGAQPADGLRPGVSAFLLGSLLNFVNVRGFGLLTEEKRLFGFQPHHFRKMPDTDDWQVRSLELVGLVVHEEPRVYETKELPRMDKIRDIPTRALDAFEAAGLESFKAGEDLYARTTPLGVRMLGAIRSVEQCVKCHAGERGDLLGAFSYHLQQVK